MALSKQCCPETFTRCTFNNKDTTTSNEKDPTTKSLLMPLVKKNLNEEKAYKSGKKIADGSKTCQSLIVN